jgi:hypothetical protein
MTARSCIKLKTCNLLTSCTSGGESMKDMQTSKEDLIRFGKPLKELYELPGFGGLSEFKDILSPLKELDKEEGFDQLSSLKDILTPIKDVPGLDSLSGKESKDSKDNKDSKDEKK